MPLISMEKLLNKTTSAEPRLASDSLPPIPAKRYFTIGEVSELCGVKPYVLRYWEQEFTQLKPMKRRGNRRYYQHHEVLLIRRIRDLLYDQGFTISGARNRLGDALQIVPAAEPPVPAAEREANAPVSAPAELLLPMNGTLLRAELLSIRDLLTA
jgi:DNA-binding transcriptional MerR regulator